MSPFLIALFVALHPLHTSSAELAFESGRATAVLRVFADDFAAEVGARPTREAVAKWTRKSFTLSDARGQPVPLAVVDMRQIRDMVQLTLRGTAPANLKGWRVHATALFARYRDQINVLRVRGAGRARTILFTPGDPPKALT